MTTSLSDQLHDLASEMPVDVPASAPGALRRVRRRRASTAILGATMVVAVIVGGAAAIRVTSNHADGAPATQPSPAPEPEAFAGVWPETTAEQVAAMQAQVDDGHQPLRLDPEQTAIELATNVFGWSYETVTSSLDRHADGLATVTIRDGDLPPTVPPVGVGVAQLGRRGADGIWTVVKVSTAAIRIGERRVDTAAGRLSVGGTLRDVPASWTLRVEVLPEPAPQAATGAVSVDGDRLTLTWPLPDGGSRTLWLLLDDELGRTVGATAIALPGTGAAPTAAPLQDLPPDLAATAQRIHDAAAAHDVEALRALLDPMTFAYNFGDGSDPTPEWAADPSVLDTLARILEMPHTIHRTEDFGDLYVWPSFVDDDLTNLGPEALALLASVGIDEAELRQMAEAGSGYLGPRTTIAADGTWLNYVTGGD